MTTSRCQNCAWRLQIQQQSTRTAWVIIASRKNYGLVRFISWRPYWTVLHPLWSRPARYCEWESLPFNDNRILLAPIGWYGLGGLVVSTERRQKPHSKSHNQLIGNQVWRTYYLTNGPVGWPPRSCDLTLLDCLFCSYVKSMVYANKPAPIDDLRTSASVSVIAMQKKSSYIHNDIERAFTEIKNFIHIQSQFCFI